MPKRWTTKEELEKKVELSDLYLDKNKTISEIAGVLEIEENTVYDRLIRLNIPIVRHLKPGFNNTRRDVKLPCFSKKLAEFIGVMLGDGSISITQVTVCLGSKEREYCEYLVQVASRLFGPKPKVSYTKEGHQTIYLGSTKIVRWLLEMGLTFNKVKSQVDIPNWIWTDKQFIQGVLRGLYDTDGSVYKLKSGAIQISFRSASLKLLNSVQKMLALLGFRPSRLSNKSVYLTRKIDIAKFQSEIGFSNQRHIKRLSQFI